MKDPEKITGYGKLRLKAYEAANEASDILDASVTDKERMKRLEALTDKQRTAYTLALMDEHAERMRAFRDAPVNAFFAELEDRSGSSGDYTFHLRSIRAPQIGMLSLRSILGESEVLGLSFDHGGDNFVTHSNLIIAEHREGPTPLGVKPGSPFQINNGYYETVEMGSVSEDSDINVVALAHLEDRVETLRVICEDTGIDEITPATVDPAPFHTS